MRKSLILGVTSLLLLSTFPAISTAAATPQTLVIIDTGIDSAIPSIKNSVVYEVCFAGYKSCPNNAVAMEGPGAATITPAMYANKAWAHGTKVASAAIQTDPDVKIIEIRCASLIGANGYIGCNNDLLIKALDWTVANKTKFNIGAVISPVGNYSATCDTKVSYFEAIKRVIAAGLPIGFPSGNDFKYTGIATPACLPGVLAISAIDDKGRLALYANYSDRVDFAAKGNLSIINAGGATVSDFGTSLSLAVFGASWLKVVNQKGLSYQATYDLFKKTGTNYTNIMVKKNVVGINLAAALA